MNDLGDDAARGAKRTQHHLHLFTNYHSHIRMFYSQQDAQPFTIPGGAQGTKGFLYPPHPNAEQSVAYIEMDGVYPERGYSMNDICTETIYVLDGFMEIEYDGAWHRLQPHDMLMILPKHRYRSKGTGTAMVFITPSWDKTQNHIINQ